MLSFVLRPSQCHDTFLIHRRGDDIHMALCENHWGIYRYCDRVWVRPFSLAPQFTTEHAEPVFYPALRPGCSSGSWRSPLPVWETFTMLVHELGSACPSSPSVPLLALPSLERSLPQPEALSIRASTQVRFDVTLR